ncbi:MAG: protease HtpX [Cardiobacteriaceae bacterium]|nr:protease HtpX [Cardiobacteriaceae bacterium]
MKPIALLVLTNAGVMAVLAIIMRLFGLDQIIVQSGSSPLAFLAIACVYGFAGSFISLFMSKNLAKRQMRVQVIEQPRNATEQWLYDTVRRQAERAGVAMPEVGIFNHPAPNAFATGANKNAALVAVSTGLLNHMSKNEVEAVLGHEMAHVYNGDMVTSTLIQGTMNTFVFVFANIISSLLAGRSRDRDGCSHQQSQFMIYMLLQTVLGVLASLVVFWHSRHREYKADQGGATLAGKQSMIGALQALQRVQQQGAHGALAKDFQAFGIVPFAGLFATHPPLAKRIAALQAWNP